MTTSKILIPIPIKEIYDHPDNPRKDIGDISELTESIKKNGIMQNLSVIPGHWEGQEWKEEGYTLIIGHRRCAAARKAGLYEVPCRVIRDMEKKEQVATMLEENMQRNDLTIVEQAQGFQMMLDLGETIDTIADKTGFSKQTVKHRVNLAKLDSNILKAKQEDEAYQLNLKDLYELEKIKDIETRNKILEDAENSNDIAWEVEQALKKEIAKENEDKIREMLASNDITEAPDKVKNEIYSPKWKRHITIALDKPIPEDINMADYKGLQFLRMQWREEIVIIEEQEVKEREPSKWEIEQKQKEEDRNRLKKILKHLMDRLKDFKLLICKGGIDIPETIENYQLLSATLQITGMCVQSDIAQLITGKGLYEVNRDEELKKKYNSTLASLSTIKRTCLYIYANGDPFTWQMEYQEDNARRIIAMCQFYETYGFSLTLEEEQLIYGTHELYKKDEV